jgi:hypothetical protein
VRFELLPGQRYDTVGVAPLIAGVAFGGLIADKAFDVDWIVAELDARGAQVVISQHPPDKAPPDRRRPLQVAPPDRELLRQTQGLQADRHARLQNRHQLRGHDLRCSHDHQHAMNLNRR